MPVARAATPCAAHRCCIPCGTATRLPARFLCRSRSGPGILARLLTVAALRSTDPDLHLLASMDVWFVDEKGKKEFGL